MIETGISTASSPAQVTLDELATFKKQDMELYKSCLLNRGKLNRGKQPAAHPEGALSRRTVNRSLNALSALFQYLTEESENTEGESYFYRNAMKKIALVQDSETYATRARHIKDQLMMGHTDVDYLNYLQSGYGETLDSARKQRYSTLLSARPGTRRCH